jgi:hypothetical protein
MSKKNHSFIAKPGNEYTNLHTLIYYSSRKQTQGRKLHNMKKNTEALVVVSKEWGLEVNFDKPSTWSCLKITLQDAVAM